ncbi:clostripain-related cysteine peptidase [Succinimonas amylolytica]|uniref:clostripain-related cysteine peptidase n=1 Tax=Succinimonas amylolytica TaxID=83769 RepID=UPI0023A7F978
MFFAKFGRRLFVFLALLAFMLFSPLAQARENVPWLIYFYLVGSDLESGGDEGDKAGGSATMDLQEIVDSMAGDNVRFLIQTGGAAKWQNDVVSSNKVQIYEVKDNDIELLKSWNNQSMGRADTLARFLEFGEQRYNPQRRMIIFWNHGSGPVGGVGYDENFSDDFLKMTELEQAFKRVYGDTVKPFDVIGFDACLMGSLTSGFFMNRWGHMMIASEEVEPSLGWFYTPWLDSLEKNPKMSLRKLGQSIVDTYVQDCHTYDSDDSVTLSAVSLDEFPELMFSYNQLGAALVDKLDDSGRLFTSIGRAAGKAESYGLHRKGNYSDVIDLKQYTDNLRSLAPKEADDLNKALSKYVIYRKNGRLKKGAGVSVYYPLGGQKEHYRYVMEEGAPSVLNVAYGLQLGTIDRKSVDRMQKRIEDGNEFLARMQKINKQYAGYMDNGAQSGSGTAVPGPDHPTEPGPDSPPQSLFSANFHTSTGHLVAFAQTAQTAQKKDITSLEDIKISFDKDSNAFVKVPKELLSSISSVELQVMLYSPPNKETPNGLLVYIGSDKRVSEDWEKGIFTDTMDGTWAAMDGHLLPLTVANATDDYITYDCDIKINGVPYNMVVAYNQETDTYGIMGVQKINENGIPGRLSNSLKPGDKITTRFYASAITKDTEEELFDNDTFEYRKDSKIKDEDLGESKLLFSFTFSDSFGNSASSELVALEINDKNELIIQSFDDVLEELRGNSSDDDDSGDDSDDEDDSGDDSDDEDDDE